VRISGQISERDFIHATFLHIRPRPSFALLGIVLAGLAVWATYTALLSGGSVTLAVLLVASQAYLLAFFLVYLPWRARRTYRQYKAVALPFAAELLADGVHFENELGASTVPWSHVRRWREGKSMFLLYPTEVLFYIVPKSAFSSPALVAEFRTSLERHLGSAT